MNTKVIWRTPDQSFRSQSDIEGVGSVRTIGEKTFRWVKNADTVALTFGQAAYHKLSDTTSMLQIVYQCLTANLSVLAGIVTATDGLDETGTSKYSWGWVQIYGANASVSLSGATTGGTDIAVGDYLKGVNAASYLVRDTSAETSYKRYVRTLEAVVTTTTPAATYKKGFIHAL